MIKDDGLKELLEQNLHIAKENNHLLRSMRRTAVYGFVGKILFWIIILGIPAYLYFSFISPILFGNASQRDAAWQNLIKTSHLSTQTVQHALTSVSTYSSVIKK